MSFKLLLEEYLNGVESYQHGTIPRTKEEMEFFLRHAHQLAEDSGYYDEFIESFPNFFDYMDHMDEFLEAL